MGAHPTTHQQAVDRLRASYAAIPPGETVRLAKKTSNLFRPRGQAAHGLDVSGLDSVLSVDADARTADVQGMCTYERLVDATLPHGMMPLVVPQLRSITLGGAVTGLGIESTSFRNGLPHESVLEMDVLTGAGEVVTATATNEHAELFNAFPNSYGSLGYATRLRIELEPIGRTVRLRHVPFSDFELMAKTIVEITDSGEYDGIRVDGMDGAVFGPGEAYLTLATWSEEDLPSSDYTGMQIYYRSLQERSTDVLNAHDYLWRWDTDWFWCSGAFGLGTPWVRRVWPQRYRRSDFYHRLVGLDRRFGIVDRLDQLSGKLQRERVIQDVEVAADRLPEFLEWFAEHVGMTPVWVCPLKLREPNGPGSATSWSCYPLEPGTTYVNIGFWGTVPVGPSAPSGPTNRAIEAEVHALGGHKSLYSEAFYDPETFNDLYNFTHLEEVKGRYDPDDRLLSLYEKAVKQR
jgi:FAD/FMN-containing dehydrogenase